MPMTISTSRLSKKSTLQCSKDQLRRHLFALLRKQGFKIDPNFSLKRNLYSKDKIRSIHAYSREEKLEEEQAFIKKWFPRIFKYFASGSDINPTRIEPYPVIVEDNEEHAALFRIAALWWSVPVSRGFGRRIRVLIFDKSNGKLFGLLGLSDPVFNLNTRDSWIGWDIRTREKKLVHIMDAYVLGAVPPYNQLLGAKFIALLATSDFIRKLFRRRYGKKKTRSIISKRKFDGKLAMITATGALGKSSIYNRLRFDEIDVFKSIGFTKGYGHFHLANGTYEKLRLYLKSIGDPEVNRFKFGSGPNYRFRVVRKALEYLQLPSELLCHGIKREVYVAPLAPNAIAFLKGQAKRLRWYHRSLDAIVRFWRERWLLPRASRDPSYRNFNREIWKQILDIG